MAAEDQQMKPEDAPLEEAVPDAARAEQAGKYAATEAPKHMSGEKPRHAATSQPENAPAESPKHAAIDEPVPSVPPAPAPSVTNDQRRESAGPEDTQPQEPVNAPGRATIPVEGRAGADATCGKNAFIAWGECSSSSPVSSALSNSAVSLLSIGILII